MDETYSGGEICRGDCPRGKCLHGKWGTVLYTSVVAGDTVLGLGFQHYKINFDFD